MDIIIGHEGPKKSGFEDLPKGETCRHPNHEPPNMMVIPQGKQYRHICPGCGREIVIKPLQYRL